MFLHIFWGKEFTIYIYIYSFFLLLTFLNKNAQNPFPSDSSVAAGAFFLAKNYISGEKLFLFVKNTIWGPKLYFS